MKSLNTAVIMLGVIMPAMVCAENGESPVKGVPSTSFTSVADVSSVFQVIAALMVIIVLIIGLSLLYKKFIPIHGVGSGSIRMLSAISLGGKEKIVLMQVGDEQIIVGVSPGYVRKIHKLKNPLPVEEATGENTFISKLNNELQKLVSK